MISAWTKNALVGGKYRLHRLIGAGAMGQVWSAENERTGREVAVKLLLRSDDELRARLASEARAYGRIRQRNVIEILDVVETDDGDPVLIMPLLSGETLRQRLKRTKTLPEPECARIGRDIARALAATHALSIVHRDLKPTNVFLQPEPDQDEDRVLVLDFGVAKNLAQSDGHQTQQGGRIGSPLYMSPEQVAGRPVDHRADIWALGVLLFEMLSGERPFKGGAAEVMVQVLKADIPRVETLAPYASPALAKLITSCMVRRREDRADSAADLAKRLDALIEVGDTGRVTLPIARKEDRPASDPFDDLPMGKIVEPASAASAPIPELPSPAAVADTEEPQPPEDVCTVRMDTNKLAERIAAAQARDTLPPAVEAKNTTDLPILTVKGTHVLSPAARTAALCAAAAAEPRRPQAARQDPHARLPLPSAQRATAHLPTPAEAPAARGALAHRRAESSTEAAAAPWTAPPKPQTAAIESGRFPAFAEPVAKPTRPRAPAVEAFIAAQNGAPLRGRGGVYLAAGALFFSVCVTLGLVLGWSDRQASMSLCPSAPQRVSDCAPCGPETKRACLATVAAKKP